MTRRLSPILLTVALLIGCGPAWHRSDQIAMSHRITRAAVYENSLSLQGTISPVRSFTDHGFRVNSVCDDAGKQLTFRSYQLFWQKELRFEAEFSVPEAGSSEIAVDVEFLSRAGTERLKCLVPIERNVARDYTTQLDRWN